jgi:hypothetical protein
LTFYESLSEELKNEELRFAVCEGDIRSENVFGQLGRRFRFGFEVSKEVEFIAPHLLEFDGQELNGLDEAILSQILSSDQLKIKSEDWLYELIWELVERDRQYFTLLQFVRFEFVSTRIAAQFIERASEFVEFVDSSIWSSLGRRFIQQVLPSTPNHRVPGREFIPQGDSLDGIITYLTSQCGGNVHDKGVVAATSSSVSGPSYHPRNAADLQNRTTSSYFFSQNAPNSWFCYDLKNMEVSLTHSTILSYAGEPNQYSQPKSWRLEVSTDGQAWTEIHHCTNNDDLNGPNCIKTYEVCPRTRCRFVRIWQTGPTHINSNHLLLCGIELFGLLHES